MGFRFKAFGLHLSASASALTLILGSLYFGWYRWPGWYLTDVTEVVAVMIGVDIVVGPLLTLMIANQKKSRRELTRDVAMIVVVQLCALIYGSVSLWNGRPLYYAFSENVIQLVQAYDIDVHEVKAGLQTNPALAPHWYRLPQWIWAPLPQDPEERQKIISSAISGGDDVISLPDYYKPWPEGLPSLRGQLKRVDDVNYFGPTEKKKLKARMKAAGFDTELLNAIPMSGRGHPVLVIFDLATLNIKAVFSATDIWPHSSPVAVADIKS
jgi:hypothetical protein